MRKILVVGEDNICGALGWKLIEYCLPNWSLASNPINTGGITKLIPRLHSYAQQAINVQPVLCIADTDRGCPKDWIIKNVKIRVPRNLIIRLAVTEAEAWVLADREGFASKFYIPITKITNNPENLPDAKQEFLNLIKKSRDRNFKAEMISPMYPDRQGSGYNLHICNFINDNWNPQRAELRSQSLKRAIRALRNLDNT